MLNVNCNLFRILFTLTFDEIWPSSSLLALPEFDGFCTINQKLAQNVRGIKVPNQDTLFQKRDQTS